MKEEKDIGVVIDDSVEFHMHISEKAYSMLAIIGRTVISLRKFIKTIPSIVSI